MNKDIKNIIKKNLPEKRTQDNLPFENSPEIYGNQRIEAYKNGFNQALSQINTSLIADEVLKVMVEKIIKVRDSYVDFDLLNNGKPQPHQTTIDIINEDILNLLTNSSTLDGERSEHLSLNKENKNNG